MNGQENKLNNVDSINHGSTYKIGLNTNLGFTSGVGFGLHVLNKNSISYNFSYGVHVYSFMGPAEPIRMYTFSSNKYLFNSGFNISIALTYLHCYNENIHKKYNSLILIPELGYSSMRYSSINNKKGFCFFNFGYGCFYDLMPSKYKIFGMLDFNIGFGLIINQKRKIK